jgi:hypothetical protein
LLKKNVFICFRKKELKMASKEKLSEAKLSKDDITVVFVLGELISYKFIHD